MAIGRLQFYPLAHACFLHNSDARDWRKAALPPRLIVYEVDADPVGHAGMPLRMFWCHQTATAAFD
jgi:hypothetical protein